MSTTYSCGVFRVYGIPASTSTIFWPIGVAQGSPRLGAISASSPHPVCRLVLPAEQAKSYLANDHVTRREGCTSKTVPKQSIFSRVIAAPRTLRAYESLEKASPEDARLFSLTPSPMFKNYQVRVLHRLVALAISYSYSIWPAPHCHVITPLCRSPPPRRTCQTQQH
jgi:hypothetical protein